MTKYAFIVVPIILATWCFAYDRNSQDQWDVADASTQRLPPTNFPQLPLGIRRNLQTRGCRIPQVWDWKTPHNVIRGMFDHDGQYDWAVLCSKNRLSSILIFWGGSTTYVSEIAKVADKAYLQVVDGDGKIGYSRAITAVGKEYILEHYRWYGGPKPPPINHQGINDIFTGKASVVRYNYRGKWLQLQGAD